MENLIKTEELFFEFQNEEDGSVYPVLKGIDLEIGKGEFVAVLGHNGSGKSTLAKHFNAILLPTKGKVFVEGIDTIDEGRLFDIRPKVGMVFQNPDNQIVATIVEEDCAFGLENLGVEPAEIRRRVDETLREVGMADYASASPTRLSGGQKQRVAVAGVLAMRPKVIVFDESTAMLDPIGRRDILALAKRLNREEGITVVWITHFMDEAVQADRVVVMDSGRIALEGTPREVFVQVDKVRALGLDVPEMMRLSQDLRAAGVKGLSGQAMTVEEMAEELCRLKSRI